MFYFYFSKIAKEDSADAEIDKISLPDICLSVGGKQACCKPFVTTSRPTCGPDKKALFRTFSLAVTTVKAGCCASLGNTKS